MFKKLCILFSLFILTIGCASNVGYVKDIAEIPTAVVVEEVKAEEVTRVVDLSKAIIEGIVLFDFDKFNIDANAKLVLDDIVAEMKDA